MKILCKWNEEAGVTESDAAVTHTVSLWKLAFQCFSLACSAKAFRFPL